MSGSLLDWRGPHDRKRRRSTGGKQREPYVLGPQGEFDREAFAAPENLMVAYQRLEREGGQAPGVDGVTFDALSGSETYSILREISQTLHNGTYRPQEHREVQIPKSNGKFRTLHLPTIFDRTVSKALQLAVQPRAVAMDPELFPDPWTIFAEIEREVRQGKATLITADVTDCFPSLFIDDALEAHRKFIENPYLLRTIEQVIRGQAGRKKTRGLSQGDPYSPLAAEVTLRDILSQAKLARREETPSLWRYADNITIASRDAHEGQRALQELQETLERYGLHLRETGSINLNAPQNESMEILGLTPRWKKSRLTWDLPGTTWRTLQQKVQACQDQPNPDTLAREILEGTLTALGPVFMTVDLKGMAQQTRKLAEELGRNPPDLKRLMEIGNQARQNWLDRRSRVLRNNQDVPVSPLSRGALGKSEMKTPGRATAPPTAIRGNRPE